MLKLYFGNLVNTVTTLLLVVLLGFIGVSICHRATITGWGRRTLLALVLGLVICCFAAARDGLDKTIQNAIDGSCAPGLFSLISIPTLAAWAPSSSSWPLWPPSSPTPNTCGRRGSTSCPWGCC